MYKAESYKTSLAEKLKSFTWYLVHTLMWQSSDVSLISVKTLQTVHGLPHLVPRTDDHGQGDHCFHCAALGRTKAFTMSSKKARE